MSAPLPRPPLYIGEIEIEIGIEIEESQLDI